MHRQMRAGRFGRIGCGLNGSELRRTGQDEKQHIINRSVFAHIYRVRHTYLFVCNVARCLYIAYLWPFTTLLYPRCSAASVRCACVACVLMKAQLNRILESISIPIRVSDFSYCKSFFFRIVLEHFVLHHLWHGFSFSLKAFMQNFAITK